MIFDILCTKDFLQKIKKTLSNSHFAFRKKTKNILATFFLHILHMLNLKKLALIATEMWSKMLVEMATEPKTITHAIFQKQVGGEKRWLFVCPSFFFWFVPLWMAKQRGLTSWNLEDDCKITEDECGLGAKGLKHHSNWSNFGIFYDYAWNILRSHWIWPFGDGGASDDPPDPPPLLWAWKLAKRCKIFCCKMQ